MMLGAKSAPPINENSALVSASVMTSATNPNSQPPSTAHITVLLSEAVNALNIQSDGIYIDGTFGRAVIAVLFCPS